MGLRAQSRGGLSRRRLHVLLVLLLAAGVVAVAQVGRGWGTEHRTERAIALAEQLLPGTYPDALGDLRILRARAG